ncbi:GNAT family N-acetyltransferase [Gracilibacillus thailandensis]|uniref:GNAT family N-acetyltransferase n=1 Tax=Gracilibacillus thailandensis TaxID=563735 RepID=A0A6N7R0L1_9BACI|nr:GNAT family N-acetyltransferase [Gracilibacillus thailandensis]MRI66580.1 GNAT family N-acetyltransferase [Gracilibacillus thailandensis]
MNLRVESINKRSKEIDEVKDLLYGSFPKNEQIPLRFLLWRAKRDFVDFLAIYDNDVFVGFTYLITNKDLTFVLYLAINAKIRSKGYGKMVLSQIKEKYPDNRIILNIEAIDENSYNYKQRVKRKKFYLRNGYQSTNLKINDSGNLYEVMINRNVVSKDEYYDLLKKYSGILLFYFVKPEISISTDL